ncbi:MAG: four helix bundle protein [Nitrospirota bacterium]
MWNEECGMRNALTNLHDIWDEEAMTRKNVVQEKSFAFALQIVKLSRRLRLDRRELIPSGQLIRSGISIGANIEEAIAAQSKRDFLAKMSIAMKEARETLYWLRIFHESGLANSPEVTMLLQECRELTNLPSSITLTTRQNLQANKRVSSPDAMNSSFHIPHSTLG